MRCLGPRYTTTSHFDTGEYQMGYIKCYHKNIHNNAEHSWLKTAVWVYAKALNAQLTFVLFSRYQAWRYSKRDGECNVIEMHKMASNSFEKPESAKLLRYDLAQMGREFISYEGKDIERGFSINMSLDVARLFSKKHYQNLPMTSRFLTVNCVWSAKQIQYSILKKFFASFIKPDSAR